MLMVLCNGVGHYIPATQDDLVSARMDPEGLGEEGATVWLYGLWKLLQKKNT